MKASALAKFWFSYYLLLYWWYFFIRKTLTNKTFIRTLQIFQFIWKPNNDHPAGIYLLKANNRNTRTRYEICSKLTIKTLERRQWCCSGVFIVNFEHISHLVLVFLLLTLNMQWRVFRTQSNARAFCKNN